MRQGRIRTRIVRAALFMLVLLLAFSACWLNRVVILQAAATLWAVSDPIENADAVAVLGGGINTRPFAAADLYNSGKVGLVLLLSVRSTRVEELKITPSNRELMRTLLVNLSVAPEAITEVGQNVSNTYEEARAVREWAQNSGAKKIIVVTEMFTSRRVRWVFNRELAMTGVKVIIHAVPDPDYDFERWWQDERGIVQFETEALKYLYYRLRY